MNEETAQTNETVANETTEVLDSNAVSQDEATETNENAEVNEETFEDENKDADTSDKQSKEENAKFAKERREREKVQRLAKEKELEEKRKRELEEVRFNAIKETLGGVNPYTKTKIEDQYDMKEYLTMKEMEKEGLDPLQDYASYLKRKQREAVAEAAKKEQTQSREKWVENDRKEFFEKYPDVNLEELFKNDKFKKFAYGKIGNISMASIYEDFKDLQTEIDKEAKKIATRLVANKQSSPGSLVDTGEQEVDWSIDDIKNMSPEEVRKNYDKIVKVLQRKG
jgi:hypothetical protein